MNPNEILRIVDAIHRDKNIDKEIVFEGIEAALVSAAKKQYGEEEDIVVHIDRKDGSISGTHNGIPLDPEETVGRIGAQTAKQVMIQKIREAERDALHDEYHELIGQMITGVVQRYEGGAATVQLNNVEAILPRSEQIPGETHHPNERVRATVFEVRKVGSRVKVILSRTRPQLVQRLFEQEIPEIADGVIEVKAMAREPGYRSKVAVSSSDQRVDSVGACVGVRGNRIKNIVDELAGERIDIVRWSDDLQVLIPNALQPAEVEEVILCQMLGRAIVLVREDQLSLAIGRRGQNVRLASKLCGWDIEIMTREELDESIERAVGGFSSLTGVDDSLAEKLVGEGFLSYDDLSIIEPDALMEMGDLTEEQANEIVSQAEVKATEAEQAAAIERRRQREQDRVDTATAAAEAAEKALLDAQAAAEAAAGTGAAETSEPAANLSDAGSEEQGGNHVAASDLGASGNDKHADDEVVGHDPHGETVPDDADHAKHAVPEEGN
ncbi:MAG TPA: transcription termination factor NusA [Pirellulales bacterium]|jgi:N utilization substance protein A|nr:transcription termination factor NusA [Pirellulales bacterium]